MIRKIAFLVVMMIGAGGMPAQAEHHSAFDKMKQMEGTWEGKLTRVTGEVVDTRSEFRLIADGNTMVETLIEDGVEMLTTYTENDGDLVVKHYCSLGTEPEFRVRSEAEDQVALQLIPDSGYHAEHHSFVAAMTYNLGAVGDGAVVVDTIIMNQGATEGGTAVIRRVQ